MVTAQSRLIELCERLVAETEEALKEVDTECWSDKMREGLKVFISSKSEASEELEKFRTALKRANLYPPVPAYCKTITALNELRKQIKEIPSFTKELNELNNSADPHPPKSIEKVIRDSFVQNNHRNPWNISVFNQMGRTRRCSIAATDLQSFRGSRLYL